ncbi:TPA: right-handed parallel beta-helix repeat-containing protein, partial [Streptococcus suis]
TNVVVRGNRIEKAGGDSLTVRDTDGALIEYNISADARYQNTGYNAGIWPFQASNTVIQYNESFRTHGVQDGQGLDLDHISNNSVMQYNYSHDNEGGFMLIMNWYEQTSPTVRYNISQNDKDKIFELARGGAQGTAIYNNTIYSDSKLTGRAGVIDMPST